jgi:hypothetical protein
VRTLFCFFSIQFLSSRILLFFLKSLNLVDTDKCHSIIGFVEIVFFGRRREQTRHPGRLRDGNDQYLRYKDEEVTPVPTPLVSIPPVTPLP